MTEQIRSGKSRVHQDILSEERQRNLLLWQAQQLHPSSALDSPAVPRQVLAMEFSPAKIPLFLVTGRDTLLESQIIPPETASCFGGLFHLNRMRWTLCSLANPTRVRRLPMRTNLGQSFRARFRNECHFKKRDMSRTESCGCSLQSWISFTFRPLPQLQLPSAGMKSNFHFKKIIFWCIFWQP